MLAVAKVAMTLKVERVDALRAPGGNLSENCSHEER